MMSQRPYDLIIYGAYGYTGRLITEVCKAKNIRVLISGRSEDKLKILSQSSGYPYIPADINDAAGLISVLSQAVAVLHCAGPFSLTSRQMVEACLDTFTHYLDITGEHEVFTFLHGLDSKAKSSGIMIMPGTGFDVVPTDCAGAYLKNALPGATQLRLAFAMVPTGVSRGTARTAFMSFGKESLVRVDGALKSVGPEPVVTEIDFGSKKLKSVCISWGDIVTAYHTTGIPNIEVFMASSPGLLKSIRMALKFRWFFRIGFIRRILIKAIDRRPPGPSENVLQNGRSLIYGKATDASGKTAEVRIETSNGYRLTADMSVLIAEKVIKRNFKPGFQTPASCYGPDLIMELPNSRRIESGGIKA
ncbi:MAG: saccharopine dehydrogenase family protein [Cyclobacteriaceae bacterium]